MSGGRGIRQMATTGLPVTLAVLLVFAPHAAGLEDGSRSLAVGDDAGRASDEKDLALADDAGLSDYLAAAALNNPGLESAYYRWQAALEKVPRMRSLPDPRLDYAYFIREVETRVGPQKQRFSLSQTFPWFGKLQLRRDIAAEGANAERERYEMAKLALFYRVTSAYSEYYYLARAVAVSEEHVRLMKQWVNVAGTRYQAANAPFGDVIRAELELEKLEDRLAGEIDLRSALSAKLAAAIGTPSGRILPWPNESPDTEAPGSDEEMERWVRERNPELRAYESAAAGEEAGARLAGKSYFPDFTLGIEMIDTDEARMPGVTDSGKDPLVAKLSMTVPLWFGAHRAEKREAEARYLAAIGARSERENTLMADLRVALYHFRDAGRRMDLYRDRLLPKAREALEVTRQSYAAGSADFTDLIETERTVLELERSYERARADRAIRLAELEMLAGWEVPDMKAEESESEGNGGGRTE